MPAKRTLALALAVATTATLTAAATPEATPARPHGVTFAVDGGTARIDPATLAISARGDDGRTRRLTASAATDLGDPGPVRRAARDRARWTYPERGLTATAYTDHGRLALTLTATRDTKLRWPVTGTKGSLQLPRGEGLDVPTADPFWTSGEQRLTGTTVDVSADLTLPLWGYSAGRHGVSYLILTDIGTSLTFGKGPDGHLRTTAAHTFDKG
ncbi:hypothetical protein [Streptomyces alboflavus]|uniref:hypothetical protein n=1 Tax=Streptomyces alboflavus TaxID=67267 RepID=UPI0030B87A64